MAGQGGAVGDVFSIAARFIKCVANAGPSSHYSRFSEIIVCEPDRSMAHVKGLGQFSAKALLFGRRDREEQKRRRQAASKYSAAQSAARAQAAQDLTRKQANWFTKMADALGVADSARRMQVLNGHPALCPAPFLKFVDDTCERLCLLSEQCFNIYAEGGQ